MLRYVATELQILLNQLARMGTTHVHLKTDKPLFNFPLSQRTNREVLMKISWQLVNTSIH